MVCFVADCWISIVSHNYQIQHERLTENYCNCACLCVHTLRVAYALRRADNRFVFIFHVNTCQCDILYVIAQRVTRHMLLSVCGRYLFS